MTEGIRVFKAGMFICECEMKQANTVMRERGMSTLARSERLGLEQRSVQRWDEMVSA